jgi:Tfp pilus assembly protein PilZ
LIEAFGEKVAWIQPGGPGNHDNGIPTEEANSKTVGDEVDTEQEAKESQKA